MKREIIKTENFKLDIFRSVSQTTFVFTPKGWHSDVIVGRITTDVFSGNGEARVYEKSISVSSGGTCHDHTFEDWGNFEIALNECRKIVTEKFDEETERLENLYLAELSKIEAEISARDEKVEELKNSITLPTREELTAIVKQMAKATKENGECNLVISYIDTNKAAITTLNNPMTKSRWAIGRTTFSSQKNLVEFLISGNYFFVEVE